MADKYISYSQKTNGYTFANIGFFYGFGGSILSSVYSLILLDIFKDPAIVGLYSAAFAVIAMLFSMFSSEIFRLLPKAKILPGACVAIIVSVFMMAFQPSAGSFIVLDVIRECAWALFVTSLTLFMTDFAVGKNVEKVFGRYYVLNNIGSIVAPIIALRMASYFGNARATLMLVSLVFMCALLYYKNYRVTAEDKRARVAPPKKTLAKVFGNLFAYLSNRELVKAYIVMFVYYAIRALRSLYVPIAVLSAGFSKDTLGLVLAIGTIPFALLAVPANRVAMRAGPSRLLMLGYITYAAFAFIASVSSGMMLLGLFAIWQISNAISEPIKELPFYNTANKSEQLRFVGIFGTAKYLASVLSPLLGAGVIMLTGSVGCVWILAGAIGLGGAWVASSIKVKKS
ncbi:MAG: MFS transporter [Rickettsiales bacterium]|jgi:MFS family permease|nr:MFS transporter [Rickettsiales bacterium]